MAEANPASVNAPAPTPAPVPTRAAAPAAPAPKVQSRAATSATSLQQSVTRIYEACQAPPLSPPDYRRLFEAMAAEITENGLQGSQTLANIQARTMAAGLQIQRDDVRFVLDVVSEPDPWFEQGASANLFAGRFRNFVVARCRGQGLNLSVEELDLIEAWFTGGPEMMARPAEPRRDAPAAPAPQRAAPSTEGWWPQQDAGRGEPDVGQAPAQDDEFPRIVRSRLRG